MKRRHSFIALLLSVSVPALAQEPTPAPQDPQVPTVQEVVVVTASRNEQALVNSPAAISVITSEMIRTAPANNIGDLLRAVPGVNVTQTSARDINIVSRASAGTLATSQLALVDGRSIYLDFFGLVMWDLVPTNPGDIKQIEVIRGPASAVWGANAMSGVVNVITKSPRELAAQGRGTLTIGVGAFDRDVEGRPAGTGSMMSVNASHAGVVDRQWSYRVSGGYLTQDPLPRPVGTMPNSFNTPYPAYQNTGTSQPKFDSRIDYDMESGGRISTNAGVAGTEGVIHSGIGPFEVEPGSRLTYFSTRYEKAGRRVAAFVNLLDGKAGNLLTTSATGQPLRLDFVTKTFDIEANDSRTVAGRHLVNYGGNFRHNIFDVSLALPKGTRNEGGAYVQDEVFFTDRVRWVVGGRVDKFSSIENAVFSPRTTLLLKPAAAHAVRLSFNRAFRAPSYTNNNIDTTIANQVNLGLFNPGLSGMFYTFPVHAVGNQDLLQETLTAYEVGYTGILNRRAAVTGSVYWNRTDDAIAFTQTDRYRASNPPPGWPLPPIVLELIAASGSGLPSEFSYVNLGTVKDFGVEMGVDVDLGRGARTFANYSYQRAPVADGFSESEINVPPAHRVNAGVSLDVRRLSGSFTVGHTSDAFWQDVLDARFHGPTDAYTLLNGAVGYRWNNAVTTSIKGTNLANRPVMQHVFGDVVRRQVTAELRVAF